MNTSFEIERKFLVREATLRDIPGLQLIEIESVYLDIDKLSTKGNEIGLLGFAEAHEDKELRVSRQTNDGVDRYYLISKVGEPALSRAESVSEIDSETYEKISGLYGKSKVNKKRFKFDYLRKTYELDVFPDNKLMIMEVELDSESQLVALPPFVNIIKEVTGQRDYYNSFLARPLQEGTK